MCSLVYESCSICHTVVSSSCVLIASTKPKGRELSLVPQLWEHSTGPEQLFHTWCLPPSESKNSRNQTMPFIKPGPTTQLAHTHTVHIYTYGLLNHLSSVRKVLYLHFTDEGMESQTSKVTCSRSHIQETRVRTKTWVSCVQNGVSSPSQERSHSCSSLTSAETE